MGIAQIISLKPPPQSAIYGGADSHPQKVELEKGCDVLAATPGRLCDFLERGKVNLEKIM